MRSSEYSFYKIAAIVCLVIMLGESLFTIYIVNLNKKSERIAYHNEELEAKIQIDNISFLRPYELKSEGYQLSPEIKIVTENGKIILIKDLLENGESALIYRFSDMHCDICIQQHISILKDLSSKIHFKLILLSTYANSKNIKILKQTHNLDFNIFNLKDDIGIPLEQTSNPYFFILDKDLQCNSFFSAIKENPQLTISCLETLFDKLNIKN